MKTVWVIEQGSYSDYRVVGVFSSKENAKMVCDEINSSDSYTYDKASVAEWPLDPAVRELNSGLTQWRVLMLRDGSTERVKPQGFDSYEISGQGHLWKRSEAPAYRGQDIQDCLDATVWAEDKEHAVKVANEIRIRMIASGEWEMRATNSSVGSEPVRTEAK